MEQTLMNPEVAALPRLSTSDLRLRYAEVFGEQPPTWNRVWMLKRLAWRLQALAEGGLSERALRRAEELANDAASCRWLACRGCWLKRRDIPPAGGG